jgi:hypothetical protein
VADSGRSNTTTDTAVALVALAVADGNCVGLLSRDPSAGAAASS